MTGRQVFQIQAAQNGRPARPQRAKGRGVLYRYVEVLSGARTKLEAVFSSRYSSSLWISIGMRAFKDCV